MGHRAVHAVHVRDVTRARVKAAIRDRLAEDGLELVTAKDAGAPGDVRMVVRSRDAVVLVELRSLVLRLDERADAWLVDEWASFLSKTLGAAVISLSIHEDVEGTTLTRFVDGDEGARFTVEGGVEPTKTRRFVVPRAVLGTRAAVTLTADSAAVAKQLGTALGVPRAWLDPYAHTEEQRGDELLVFRRRAEPPVLPKRGPRPTGFEPAVAAYRGREHAVGAFAFDARADLEMVSECLSAFLRAFCPREGLAVRASRGTKTEVLAARFTQSSSVSARQLARGGSVELSTSMFEPVNGRCYFPLFWIASRPHVDGGEDLVPLRFGLCIARPGADRPERAIAHALHTLVESCVELEGCVSAIVTAQGPPSWLGSPSLAYEELAGTTNEGTRTTWLRSHVRSPGWRVLVPRERAREVARSVPGAVTIERVRSGLLASLDAPTPYAVGSTEAMERWLAPLLS